MVGEPLFVPDFEASLVYRGSSKVPRAHMEKPSLENEEEEGGKRGRKKKRGKKKKEEEEEVEEEEEEEEGKKTLATLPGLALVKGES